MGLYRVRPDSTGDKELTDGMLRGDPQAWRRLCETYGAPLYLYAYHRTGGDRFAAEDIVQATLLAAVESISSYGRQVPLFAWLCGIARHKAADESRRAVLGLLAPYSLPVPRTLAVAVPIANLAMAPLAALAIVKRRSLSHAR